MAKGTVMGFLHKNGLLDSDLKISTTEEASVFGRLLDRSLAAGFGHALLQKVPWEPGSTSAPSPSTDPSSSSSTPQPSTPPSKAVKASTSTSKTSRSTGTTAVPGVRTDFTCALGKSVEPSFTELSKASKWYASRKLDGVRSLALVDFFVPADPSSPPEFDAVYFISRNGRAFNSLGNLEPQIELLAGFPRLREWLDRDPEIVAERRGGVIKRLVLDGEVCVMVPVQGTSSPDRKQSLGTADSEASSSSSSGASALWGEHGLKEDFTQAVSAVKRSVPIEHPAYYLFDLLSWAEALAKGAVDSPGLSKSFGERADELQEFVDWLNGNFERQGMEEKMIKRLVQWEVAPGDVESMVNRSSDEGWEGLIFRADTLYKGTRS